MKTMNDQIRSRFTQIRSQRSRSLPVRSGLSRLPWTRAPAPPSIGKNQAARPGTVPIKASHPIHPFNWDKLSPLPRHTLYYVPGWIVPSTRALISSSTSS
ncbi:Uncharacterized protein HZ326_0510 [Fusarium oxysporum f. sp. albedinis]|nr:Uncharacterized protein HZ326_0510 [Fusarium oxysporum f. sp. albedinis]